MVGKKRMPRGGGRSQIPSYYGHCPGNEMPPSHMQRGPCYPDDFGKMGPCGGMSMPEFKSPMIANPEPPIAKKKRRTSSAAAAAAAAAAAVAQPPVAPIMQDLLPPPLSGYGDTIIASNPFDDAPILPSPMMSSMNRQMAPMGNCIPPNMMGVNPCQMIGSGNMPMGMGGCGPPGMNPSQCASGFGNQYGPPPSGMQGPSPMGPGPCMPGRPGPCMPGNPPGGMNMQCSPVGPGPMYNPQYPMNMSPYPMNNRCIPTSMHCSPNDPSMNGGNFYRNNNNINNSANGMVPPRMPNMGPNCQQQDVSNNAVGDNKSRMGPVASGMVDTTDDIASVLAASVGENDTQSSTISPSSKGDEAKSLSKDLADTGNLDKNSSVKSEKGNNGGGGNTPVVTVDLCDIEDRDEKGDVTASKEESRQVGSDKTRGEDEDDETNVSSSTSVAVKTEKSENSSMGGHPTMGHSNIPPGSMHYPTAPNPSRPMSMSSGKVYPVDKSKVFNSQNPNAPPIYPCGACHKEVPDNDQAILCESGCNFWFHRICSGLSEAAFQLLTAEVYAEWVCDSCLSTKSIPLVKFKP